MESKNVQIPKELFFNLMKYFVLEIDDPEIYQKCYDGIQNKFECMYNRELYSKFHDKNLSTEEQEKARQEYLDRVGVLNSFRWENTPQEAYDTFSL